MKRSPSKPGWLRRWTPVRVVQLLVVTCLFVLVLPAPWAARLRGVIQAVLPFQRASRAMVDAVAPPGGDVPQAITSDQYRQLLDDRARLEHTVAALHARVTELESDNALLLATRTTGLGAAGKLIEANLLAEDPATWRRSVLLDRGAHGGVAQGAAVMSKRFVLDRGSEAGLADHEAVLLGEVLIGVIEQANAFSSRVRLLSDPATQIEVRIGRGTEDGFDAAPGAFWLTGAGGGEMVIRDVVKSDVDAGRINVGDAVLARPVETVLPAAMTIGHVARIDPDVKNPLLVILRIRAGVDVNTLRRVFVYQSD